MKKKSWKRYMAAGLAAVMIMETGPVNVLGLRLKTFANPDVEAATSSNALGIGERQEENQISLFQTDERTYAVLETNAVLTYHVTENSEITITDCNDDVTGELEIPSQIDGYPVTGIADHAFDYCKFSKVVFPESIVSIGEYSFYDCDYLVSVSLENSNITKLSSNAFAGDGNLAEILLPAGLKEIEERALFWCSALTSIFIPATIDTIGNQVFAGCLKLTDVYYGGSEEEWKVVEVGTNNQYLDSAKMHYSDTDERTYAVPETNVVLTYIVAGTDSVIILDCNDDATGELEIPSQIEGYPVTDIADHAFDYCKFTKVVFPSSVRSIGEAAFYDCDELVSASLKNSSITKLSPSAFAGDGNLAEILLPAYLEEIGESAFFWCNQLTSIFIPSTVKTIGNQAFDGCLKLTDVYYESGITGWRRISIGDKNSYLQNATLHWGTVRAFLRNIYQSEILNDLSIANSYNVDYEINMETICEAYASTLQEKGFDTRNNIWKACDLLSSSLDDPTKLYDFAVEPKEIYTAMILDIVEESVDMELVANSEWQKMIKKQAKYVSLIKDNMQLLYDLDIRKPNDYAALTKEQRDKLSELTEAFFKDEFKEVYEISEVMSGACKGIKIMSNINDFYKHCASILLMAELSQSVRNVVAEACKESKNSGDLYLQAAFKECDDLLKMSREELINKLIDEKLDIAGEEIIKYGIRELWKGIKTNLYQLCPEVAVIQAAYKMSKQLVNSVANTDKISEQYGKMLALCLVEQTFDQVYDSFQAEFLKNKTEENAANYLAALEIAFRSRDQDCVEAWNFVNAIDNDDAWINQLFNYADAIDKAKSDIRSRQGRYYGTYEMSQIEWIYHLPDDFPDSGLYETYEKLFDESLNRILTKKWVSACPVDVYVYDSADQLVAYVEGKKVFCDADLTVILEGDVKTICFYDDADDYRIKYVGNDTGKMDITVTEYQDDELSRTVNYYDIALTKGKTYVADAMSSDCELNDLSGNMILPDYDSLNPKDHPHKITIQSGSMIKAGELLFETEAYAKETLDINAYIPEGASFIRWEASNGENVFGSSTSPNTTLLMPDEDIIVKAVTDKNAQETPEESKVTSITLKAPDTDIFAGDQFYLPVTIQPENASDKTLVWSSSDPAIAAVSTSGLVTALKAGKVEITVSLTDGRLKNTVTLIISDKKDNTAADDKNGNDSDHENDPNYDSDHDSDRDSDEGGNSSGKKPSRRNGGSSSANSLTGGSASFPSYVVTGTWTRTADGNWTFTDSKGVAYKNRWAAVYNPYANKAVGQNSYDWFYFDENGFMATGWITDHNRRYYLNPVSDGTRGCMFTGWKQIGGKWYYLNEISDGTKGAVITDTWIDKKYYVNKNGIWEEEKANH